MIGIERDRFVLLSRQIVISEEITRSMNIQQIAALWDLDEILMLRSVKKMTRSIANSYSEYSHYSLVQRLQHATVWNPRISRKLAQLNNARLIPVGKGESPVRILEE